ncbi:MAG: GDSL-type esterase/lipase family protein [Bacteroidota bacterium]
MSSLQGLAQAGPKYLKDVRNDLRKTWPNNRTINLVFHGHSVPSGYFTTPEVRKFESYPHLTLVKIKEEYKNAVVNSITTSIGGEHAEEGAKRFAEEVITMRPDVLFIDYALNDRGIGLERARVAWQQMIDMALAHKFTDHNGNEHRVKIILLTPTPDTTEDILSDESPLALYSEQIRELAKQNDVGLIDSYALFKEIAKKESLSSYNAQSNQVNKKGHQVVATEIAKLFTQVE